jgi:hypothetical protein
MSTTAQKPATTPIPVQLSAPEFEVCILPHLSMPKRGLKCKLGYCRVFNLILWVLYASVQTRRGEYVLTVVCDAGTLIALTGIGQLHILVQVGEQVVIPMAVYDEVVVRGQASLGRMRFGRRHGLRFVKLLTATL